MSENNIEISGLEKTFPGMKEAAVYALTAAIRGGTVTGLAGPDGAGKTTLMRLLAGLLKPSAGSISAAGLNPAGDGAELRSMLGYMPQRFGLYEDLPVIENLRLYAALRGVEGLEREEAFARLLRFTGLTPFTARLAGRLSGGMKQKLGLACTLLGKPRILLLDEPGVGVDPISRRELWAMVHELAQEGMLILWSTSYLDEAEQCPEVILLNQGRMLYHGPPRGLTDKMAGRSWLLAPAGSGKRKLQQQALLLPMISDATIQGASVRLILRQADGAPEAARALGAALIAGDAPGLAEAPGLSCAAHGPAPAEAAAKPALSPAEPRFEDAFIDLLGGGPGRESELARIMDARETGDGGPVIEAVGLTKKFGAFTATDQVDFAVRQGEIFGLLGPNGAGKSTTFRMMCGLLRPSAGQALVFGLDLERHPAAVRQKIGYMAQKFSLYGGLTVEQNLFFFSGVYGLMGREQKRRVEEMIDAFSLAPILGQAADALPLGFKQRLALACSLMHRPDILFLDEPTSGVDPLTRREFWLHINSMVEKGVTVMVTTHFMDEAEYCDRIGLVYHGRLIASGSPDELKAGAASPEHADPTMEDAFIHLINKYDQSHGPS